MRFIKQLLLRSIGSFLNNRDSKIIFYHDIYSINKYTEMSTNIEMFRKHLECITDNHFKLVSSISENKNEIQMCFDDGFAGIWDCRETWDLFDWRPTIFIAVKLIGNDGYLNIQQIKTLSNQGYRFESHGWNHCPLTRLTDNQLLQETSDSKKYLEDSLGFEINEICFPLGAFSPKVIDACLNAGYKLMYSSIPGTYFNQVFPNIVRRNLVQFYNSEEFKSVLFGGLIPFSSRYLKMHYDSHDK